MITQATRLQEPQDLTLNADPLVDLAQSPKIVDWPGLHQKVTEVPPGAAPSLPGSLDTRV